MQPVIIGLGHYSRTGKDTFANALIDILQEIDPVLRVGRRSFASKLKSITSDLYGWAGLGDEAYYNKPEHEHERDQIIPALGMTPVEIWVKFGTPAVREQVYGMTWVDHLLKTDHGLDVMIIPDVRFPNEVEAIRMSGGYLMKIVRDGYGPKLTVADLALIHYTGWDNVIGDLPPGKVDGIANLKQWAGKYASKISLGEDLHLLDRPSALIARALRAQDFPSQVAIADVYEAAGLKYEEYAA